MKSISSVTIKYTLHLFISITIVKPKKAEILSDLKTNTYCLIEYLQNTMIKRDQPILYISSITTLRKTRKTILIWRLKFFLVMEKDKRGNFFTEPSNYSVIKFKPSKKDKLQLQHLIFLTTPEKTAPSNSLKDLNLETNNFTFKHFAQILLSEHKRSLLNFDKNADQLLELMMLI